MKLIKLLINALCILSAIICAAIIVCALWLYAMDEPLCSWSSSVRVSAGEPR